MTTQPHSLPDSMLVVISEGYQLTHADRCDRCGARAYVCVILESNCLDLYFCRHDWMKLRPALLPQCTYVNDETRALFDGIKDDGHCVDGKALPAKKAF